MFDINDFDETYPGPWEWDVKRLAASFVIAGRENGYTTKERRDIVRATVRRYQSAMREFAAMRELDVWYARVDLDTAKKVSVQAADQGAGRSRISKNVAKARTRDSMQAYAKLVRDIDGQRRIISGATAHRAHRGADAGRGSARPRGGHRRPAQSLQENADQRTARAARNGSGSSTWRARSSASAASARAAGSCC